MPCMRKHMKDFVVHIWHKGTFVVLRFISALYMSVNHLHCVLCVRMSEGVLISVIKGQRLELNRYRSRTFGLHDA